MVKSIVISWHEKISAPGKELNEGIGLKADEYINLWSLPMGSPVNPSTTTSGSSNFQGSVVHYGTHHYSLIYLLTQKKKKLNTSKCYALCKLKE